MSKDKPNFVRVLRGPSNQICRVESLEMIPKLLVERFGQPSLGDVYKVSGIFEFTDNRGTFFTVYDWKKTGDFPAYGREEFWNLEDVVRLEIGSNSRAQKALRGFLTWLGQTLEDGLQTDQDWLASLASDQCSVENQERVLHLVEHGGTKTQLAALEAIRRIGEPITTPALLSQLFQMLHERQPLRPAVIKALSAFNNVSDVDWVQAGLIEQLDSQFAATRCNGILAIGALGPKVWTDRVLTRFAELLVEEPTVDEALLRLNWIAGRSLRMTPPPPTPGIIFGVARQLDSPNGRLRGLAAHAVVTLGTAAMIPAVLTPLFRLLGDSDHRTSVPAEMSFNELGQLAAIPGLLAHLCTVVQPKDFRVKAKALRVVEKVAKITGESEDRRKLIRIIKGLK